MSLGITENPSFNGIHSLCFHTICKQNPLYLFPESNNPPRATGKKLRPKRKTLSPSDSSDRSTASEFSNSTIGTVKNFSQEANSTPTPANTPVMETLDFANYLSEEMKLAEAIIVRSKNNLDGGGVVSAGTGSAGKTKNNSNGAPRVATLSFITREPDH